jgi:magnesium transporter
VGADHLLYGLADEMDEAIDQIETQIFEGPSPDTLERIFALKRAALRMRRTISPQREMVRNLARDPYAVIDAKDRIFFRDVYDHLVRLYEINESLRDLVGGALDTYLSVINNRMNNAIKTMAVITTLFMPISFVAGFFGMNFFGPVIHLEGLTSGQAFALTVVTMVLPPAILYFWIRRRGWI